MKEDTPIIGFDAKRAVANGTGLGSYSRTLINDLARYPLTLRLYAPDEGRDDLRTQIQDRANVTLHTPHSTLHIPHSTFHIPHSTFHIPHSTSLGKSLWRSHGIVSDLRRDGIQLYHGLRSTPGSSARPSARPPISSPSASVPAATFSTMLLSSIPPASPSSTNPAPPNSPSTLLTPRPPTFLLPHSTFHIPHSTFHLPRNIS